MLSQHANYKQSCSTGFFSAICRPSVLRRDSVNEIESGVFAEKGARRWAYSEDGLNARCLEDGAVLTLVGDTQSKRRQNPEWQYWMTTLQFRLTSSKYVCEFEIERQIYTVTRGVKEDSLPHIVWYVNYPAMRVGVGGRTETPVSDLGFEEWLDFDVIFLGALYLWPRLADEAELPDFEGNFHRTIYFRGGYLGGEWSQSFVRTRPYFCTGSSFTKAGDLRRTIDRKIIAPTHGWQFYGTNGYEIRNNRTGISLKYDEPVLNKLEYTKEESIYKDSHIFKISIEGESIYLIIRIAAEISERASVWRINIADSLLYSSGYSIEDVGNIKNRQKVYIEREKIAPDTIYIAGLVQHIFDATIHWPRIDDVTGLPPIYVAIAGLGDESNYWPYNEVHCGRGASSFLYFDYSPAA